MAGHRNFNELRAKISPERRARNEAAVRAESEQMRLAELRALTGSTQVDVAAEMGITQSALSRLERQPDMHLGTLRRLVAALGGELEIVAKLPDRRVVVTMPKVAKE